MTWLPRLLLALTLATAPAGCSYYQALAQRQAIAQAQFRLKSVNVGGIDFAGANLYLTLELVNPTSTQIVLDRIDYKVYLNDQRLLSGFSDQRVTVPPGEVRPLTLQSSVRFADLGDQARRLMGGKLEGLRVEGTGHFDTPFGTIDYPIQLFQQ